ncbi:MAG: hypothetical protein EAZ55_11015 [Cytophagales bacterium]|nr:MAG: hypothetical protein EAZ55_11015 [Cytophagales bacterium]
MYKKLLFTLFLVFMGFCGSAYSQQMSKGITYRYAEGSNWMKINTGLWMGENWYSFAISTNPEEWIQCEIIENKGDVVIILVPKYQLKLEITYLGEGEGISVTPTNIKDPKIFAVYERYGELVEGE